MITTPTARLPRARRDWASADAARVPAVAKHNSRSVTTSPDWRWARSRFEILHDRRDREWSVCHRSEDSSACLHVANRLLKTRRIAGGERARAPSRRHRRAQRDGRGRTHGCRAAAGGGARAAARPPAPLLLRQRKDLLLEHAGPLPHAAELAAEKLLLLRELFPCQHIPTRPSVEW